MIDESFLAFALSVWDKGGPVAFSAVLIAGAWWWRAKQTGNTTTETQMTAALKALEARVQANHEIAQDQREELRKAVSGHGERIARIEGRIDGL